MWHTLPKRELALHSRCLRSDLGTVILVTEEESTQALAGTEFAGHELALRLLGLGKHAKLAGADVKLFVVLGGHEASSLTLALHTPHRLFNILDTSDSADLTCC